MRILFVHDSLVGGGTERRIVQLIKGLNKSGHNDLHLLCFSDVNDYPMIHNYNVKLYILKRSMKWDAFLFFKVFRLIKRINPTIIHTWSIMAAFYISIISKILHIPHLSGFITSGSEPKNGRIHRFAKLLSYSLADAIIGNSTAGLNAYKAPQNKRKVIYNGFDMDRLRVEVDTIALKRHLNIATLYVVVMVGRFEMEKDFQTFFLAANQLIKKRNDITFLAIGKGSLFLDYERKIENKELIRILDFKTDIDPIIKMSDIGVLCNNPHYGVEGISNSLMEFMAFGKPVIATNGGGTNELISNTETGLIIEPQNPHELANKINSLLNNKSLLLTIGENAKMSIETKFSLRKMTEAYIELYCEYLKEQTVKIYKMKSSA